MINIGDLEAFQLFLKVNPYWLMGAIVFNKEVECKWLHGGNFRMIPTLNE